MSFKKAFEISGAAVLGAYLACCGGNKLVLPEKNPAMNQKIDLSEVPGMNRIRMGIDFPRADSVFIGTLSKGEIELKPELSDYLTTNYTFSDVECAKYKKTRLSHIGKLESINGASELSMLLPGITDHSFYYFAMPLEKKMQVMTAAVKGLDKKDGKINMRIKDMGTKQGERYILFVNEGSSGMILSNIYPATDSNVNLLEAMLKSYNHIK